MRDPEPVAVAELTDDCWANVSTAGAVLRVDTDRTIRADPAGLEQLLENLFRNAVEHGGEEVTVTVGDLEEGFCIRGRRPGDSTDRARPRARRRLLDDRVRDRFGLSIVEEVAGAHG